MTKITSAQLQPEMWSALSPRRLFPSDASANGQPGNNPKVRVADQDEAAGAADATAWVSREISGVLT